MFLNNFKVFLKYNLFRGFKNSGFEGWILINYFDKIKLELFKDFFINYYWSKMIVDRQIVYLCNYVSNHESGLK